MLSYIWPGSDFKMLTWGHRLSYFQLCHRSQDFGPLTLIFSWDFPQGFWQDCLWTNLAQSSIRSKTNLWNHDVCCAINVDFRRNMFATRLFPRFSKEPRFLWNLILIWSDDQAELAALQCSNSWRDCSWRDCSTGPQSKAHSAVPLLSCFFTSQPRVS